MCPERKGHKNRLPSIIILAECPRINNIANSTIHNLEMISLESTDNPLHIKITLHTRDSSYDLNGFYTELTKKENGYIIL